MLRRIVSYFERGIFTPSRIGATVAAVLIPVLMVITVTDLILRRFLNSPLPGTVEMSGLILSIIAFASFAACAVARGNIDIDNLVSRLPTRAQHSIMTIVLFLSAVFIGLISWQLVLRAMRLIASHESTSVLGIWLYPFYLIAALGSALLCLVFFVQFLQSAIEVRRQ